MRHLKLIILTTLLSFSSLAFATQKPMTAKPQFTNPDKPILIPAKQDHFKIVLQANATTGYSWFLGAYNHQAIKPVSYRYVAPNSKLAGAPGYVIWKFKVNHEALSVPQVFKLKLVYTRPWEKKAGEETTFTVYTSGR